MKYLIICFLFVSFSANAYMQKWSYDNVRYGLADNNSKGISFNATEPYTAGNIDHYWDMFYINKDVTFSASATGDAYVLINRGAGNYRPGFRWNEAGSKLQYTNNGVDYSDVGTGGGGGDTVTTQTLQYYEWAANGSTNTHVIQYTATAQQTGSGIFTHVNTAAAGMIVTFTSTATCNAGMTVSSDISNSLHAIVYKPSDMTDSPHLLPQKEVLCYDVVTAVGGLGACPTGGEFYTNDTVAVMQENGTDGSAGRHRFFINCMKVE